MTCGQLYSNNYLDIISLGNVIIYVRKIAVGIPPYRGYLS